MEPVLVSVLMTAYNREKYIGIAIESVLASTYPNFELIITDDRSTDATVRIAREYEARDNRIKVYINETNLGDYPNRNKAASYAKGKYLKYLDADDYMYPHGLAAMVFYLEQANNNRIALGVFSLGQDRLKPFPFILSPEEAYGKHFLQDGFLATAPCSTILNRELFLQAGGFSGKKMVGDLEMWLRLAATYDTMLMPGHYCWYRVHDEQEINTYNNYRSVYHEVMVAALMNKNCPLGAGEKERCLRKVNKSFARAMLNFLLKRRDLRLYRINVKHSQSSLFKLVAQLLK